MAKRYQVTVRGAASTAERSTKASAKLEHRIVAGQRSAITGRYVELNPARTATTIRPKSPSA